MFFSMLSSSLYVFLISATPAWMNEPLYRENFSLMDDIKLQEFCDKWDTVLSTDTIADGHPMLGEIWLLSETPYAKRKIRILHYRNKEIVERVCKLFIAEYQAYLARNTDSPDKNEKLNASIERHGNQYKDLPLANPDRLKGEELELEYFDELCTLAQSTFDPSIYEEVWELQYGYLVYEYLSEVEPEKTLNIILSAIASEQTLILNNGRVITISEVFKLLHLTIDKNPDLARQRRDEIIGFLKKFSLYLSTPMANGKYYSILDFVVRRKSIQILAEIGMLEDIEFVGEIIANAPVLPNNHSLTNDIANTIPWNVLKEKTIYTITKCAGV